MNLKQLQAQLKSDIKPIYLVVGDETSLNDKAREIFKGILDEQELEMNFSSFDLLESTLEDVMNEAISTPFFGERRLIFADNPVFLTGSKESSITQNTDILSDYLNNPMPTSTLVLFASY